MRFIIEDSFWDTFEDAKIGVVVCRGIDNNTPLDLTQELKEAQNEAKKHIASEDFTSNPVIYAWREAFKKFKTKKGARASIEALLKRVKNNNELGSINPLVDIYNIVSLKYGFPCGGEDINKFSGDLLLTKANGDEDFLPLGSDKNSPPYPDEIVYKDDVGAVCRCFNWREAYRTILTEDTINAFLCIENIEGRDEDLKNALSELMETSKAKLGGEHSMYFLDKDNKSIEI